MSSLRAVETFKRKRVGQTAVSDNQSSSVTWRHAGLVVRASDSGARGWEFDTHSGHRVVSLSKTHLPPKSTVNTQEAVASSQHD